jgi:hypothetical protein
MRIYRSSNWNYRAEIISALYYLYLRISMSNRLINAVIALVEDRPTDAREMLRSPELAISVTELQMRLHNAIHRRERAAAITQLKQALLASLTYQPPESYSDKEKEAYFAGINRLETWIDERIEDLEPYTESISQTVPRRSSEVSDFTVSSRSQV